MNTLSKNQLILTITVLLVLGAVVFILLPKPVRQGTLLGHQLDNIYNNLNSFCKVNQTNEENYSTLQPSNIPSFKNNKSNKSEILLTQEVNFTANNYPTTEFQTQKQKVNSQAVESSTSPTLSYNYSKTQNTSNYSSGIHAVSSQENALQTSKTAFPVDKGLQPLNVFEAKNQYVNKNSPNTFLAINSLTITTDLSDNNSAMLIGGDTSPGDPGIPVGDGFWILDVACDPTQPPPRGGVRKEGLSIKYCFGV
jgi:hypothetical protein